MKKLLLLLQILLVILCSCSSNEPQQNHNPEKIVIALLDTGVSTTAINGEHLLAGYNYVTKTEDTEDLINHGTAVASTILGCKSAEVIGEAPEAYIVPLVVVTKQNGKTVSALPEQLAQAIRDSIDIYHADIINVSLGIQKDHTDMREAVAYAEKMNVPVISAVGNEGDDGKPYYPAAYDTVLAVGSCDKNGSRSAFTQNGAEVLAPGENIILASRNGVSYAVKGTSFSTGYVSAYAAKILIKNPNLTPKKLFDIIIEKKLVGI